MAGGPCALVSARWRRYGIGGTRDPDQSTKTDRTGDSAICVVVLGSADR